MATSLRAALDAVEAPSAAALGTATGVADASLVRQSARAFTRQRYLQTGGFRGQYGLPIGDIWEKQDGTYAKSFAGGTMHVLNGSVPIDHAQHCVALRFVGFHNIEESNESSSSDEPYFIVAAVGSNGSSVVRFGPFEDVDAGEDLILQSNVITLEQAISPPFLLAIIAMENDEGTPEEAEAKVRDVVTSIESKLDEAGAAIGAVDTDGHVMPEWFRDILIGWVPEWIANLFGLADDYVGQTSHVVLDLGDFDKENDRWASIPVLSTVGPGAEKYNIKLPVGTDPSEGRYETYFMAQVVKRPAPELEN